MTPDTDPHRIAYRSLMEAAAWLHSIGTAPGDEASVLAGDAQAAATEVMDLIAAYAHLWPDMPAGAPIADPG
jgi:hypothetical protein